MKNQQQEEQAFQRLLNATSTDWTNRSNFINKVKQTEKVTVFTEDGTPIETEVEFFITWESIKAVLELVNKKAKLPDDLRVSVKQESN
ncbi:hypothetical protein [Rhizobium phage RHph_X2_28B]|uniref:hypothetical protein n=1 Tax=Rhizobium phage RHph_X2_28B TaxID=2836086 RepID=UPI0023293D78|nr:hypothetical protein PP751_gp052 [Rhizobium phage RHph_X2_28B]QWY83504.1 hypothetical protein [Rhizobium phage RHph_X2_28B]QWY83740.1 hypothetical protein [Rhizobium phage RHph_X3_15]